MFKNSTHEIIVHKTPKFAAQYGCELLYNSDYPHSRNGSGGYPPSGGGIKEGGRVPRDAPVLSLNISPAMIRKSTNQMKRLGRNVKGKSIKLYILVLKKRMASLGKRLLQRLDHADYASVYHH